MPSILSTCPGANGGKLQPATNPLNAIGVYIPGARNEEEFKADMETLYIEQGYKDFSWKDLTIEEYYGITGSINQGQDSPGTKFFSLTAPTPS